MRILVTGGTGFVGREVVKLLSLDASNEVHILTTQSDLSNQNIFYHQHDFLKDIKGDGLKNFFLEFQPTHLLHMAWCTDHGKYWSSPENFNWQLATYYLVENFCKFGGAHITITGTCAEYAWDSSEPLLETYTALPDTTYGIAKLSTKYLVDNLIKHYGIEGAWLRIFHLYGEKENPKRLLPYLVDLIGSGGTPTISSTEKVRDFMHVSDLARVIQHVIKLSLAGTYNIGSNHAVNLLDIVMFCNDLFGKAKNNYLIDQKAGNSSDPIVLLPNIDKILSTGWTPEVDFFSYLPAYIRNRQLNI